MISHYDLNQEAKFQNSNLKNFEFSKISRISPKCMKKFLMQKSVRFFLFCSFFGLEMLRRLKGTSGQKGLLSSYHCSPILSVSSQTIFYIFFSKKFFSEVFIALIEAVKVRNPARFCQNFPMKRNLLIFTSKRSKEISCIEKLMQIF